MTTVDIEQKSALLNLAARVAHDIRSPIATMEIGLHLIEQRHTKKDFILMRMAIQRIRDIANNLLDQYRDQSVPKFISIKALLAEVVLLKRYEWLEKNCEIILSCDSVTDLDLIIGDAIEIKRMLSNLLNNAIEACSGDANIRVNVNKIDKFIEISISDNGAGIPAEKIESYLNGESSKHPGVGLGLSGAKQYMENDGGELLLTSQPGIGTSITLKFAIDKTPSRS